MAQPWDSNNIPEQTGRTVAVRFGVWSLEFGEGPCSSRENLCANDDANVSMGALPTLYAAVEGSVKSGSYTGPSGFMEVKGYPKEVASNALANNEEFATKLWRVSEKLTGISY
jgi:hypothetical protein